MHTIDLVSVFPSHQEVIRHLRRLDDDFDEICLDFELLSRELSGMDERCEERGNDLASQIFDSLNGLAEEIANRLNRNSSIDLLQPLLPEPILSSKTTSSDRPNMTLSDQSYKPIEK